LRLRCLVNIVRVLLYVNQFVLVFLQVLQSVLAVSASCLVVIWY
jgi:hypothetical protein